MHAYHVHMAISIITPPLTPHLSLPKITIIRNNYRDKSPRFRQAVTITTWHDGDCYVQFEYSCKQLFHIEALNRFIRKFISNKVISYLKTF